MSFPFFEIRKQNGRTITRGHTSCSLGHGFEAGGQRQGVFASWRWDGTRLVACTDRLGFYNLFYGELPDGVIVSPSVLQLIAEGASCAPNDRALGMFFRLGVFLGEDTPFQAIHALPPGGVLVWEDGHPAVTGEPEIIAESAISPSRAADQFSELMHQAVARSLRSWDGELVLPLSGGRDSRHILLEMNEHRTLPSSCVTYHYGVGFLDHEAEAASRIAAALGVPHVLLNGPRLRVRDRLRALVATHLCSDEHAQMIQLGDHCAGDRAVVDGIGGDILSRNLLFANLEAQRESAARNYAGLAGALLRDHRRIVGACLSDVFDPVEVERRFPEAEAVEYLTQTLRRFDAAADPFTSFHFWNRTRREINLVPTAIHADAAAVLCPYLDADLQRFLASLPIHVTRSNHFHDEVIAKAFPRFAHIPYGDEMPRKPSRTPAAQKVLDVVDVGLVAAMLFPGPVVRELAALVGPTPKGVSRKSASFLRYYRLIIDSMDAHQARRLLEIADRCAPRRIRRLREQQSRDRRARAIRQPLDPLPLPGESTNAAGGSSAA